MGLILSQDTELERMREALRFATDFSLWLTVLDDELEKRSLDMDSGRAPSCSAGSRP